MKISYAFPLTVYKICKVKKVEVYPINGVHHIHIKAGETNSNNSKICNISFPKILIRVINHRMDRKQLVTS